MSEANPSRDRLPWVPVLVVVAGAVLPFLGALSADFVNWDDDLLLLDHDRYRGFSAAHLLWMFGETHAGHYQPLTWLSYALDHAIWGLDPFGFHLTNLVLHAANALALWFLLRVLSRGAVSPWWAAAGALLFAVHPLRVESVAWVTERRDLLSGLFWLLTVTFYVRSRRREAAAPRRDFGLAIACMALSLFAKAWAITMPLVLLALDLWPLGRRRAGVPLGRLLLEKVPFIALALLFSGTAMLAQTDAGARLSYDDHTLLARCAQAAYGLCFYLQATFWPFDLSPLYPLERALDPTEPRFLVSAALMLAALPAAWLLRHRAPGVVAGAFVYVVVLLPVLGFAQSGPQLVADRYSYLACIVIPAGLVLWPRLRAAGRRAALPAAAILAGLALLAARQTAVWRDSIALWEHTLALAPDSFNAHLNYADALRSSDPGRALAEYRRTVELQPNEHKAWTAIGAAELRRGEFEASLRAYTEAHRLQPGEPAHLHGMAVAALQLGRLQDCVQYCEQCHAVDPDWPHAWPVLGDALLRLDRRGDARAAFERAVAADPENEHARRRLRELR